MLAVFEKSISNPPEELSLPSVSLNDSMTREEILGIFRSSWTEISEAIMGFPRQATEAIVVVEAYKVLRDRAPYPIDQVIKDLQGNFAFILFDAPSGTLFVARDGNGSVDFHWGLARDGSLVCSNNPNIIKETCGKSCAPFPPGCIFRNGSGLISFDHPLNKVRAIARQDDVGNICGVSFQVDFCTRLHSIPRTGSASNWADGLATTVSEEQSPPPDHDRDYDQIQSDLTSCFTQK
ncbi:Nucleophile aminohydrolase, N-terminal [Parasponia andersonii]|uniref:Nucleophile aminohydrolase, N-terminal n=1 Tax=Parasponia andersonii TaxID=3476 RepID=A0A2P5AJQ1_PARAD|nr:Nucleophile aminohydrolase, N-terminal [Parasponia andersonii]